ECRDELAGREDFDREPSAGQRLDASREPVRGLPESGEVRGPRRDHAPAVPLAGVGTRGRCVAAGARAAGQRAEAAIKESASQHERPPFLVSRILREKRCLTPFIRKLVSDTIFPGASGFDYNPSPWTRNVRQVPISSGRSSRATLRPARTADASRRASRRSRTA